MERGVQQNDGLADGYRLAAQRAGRQWEMRDPRNTPPGEVVGSTMAVVGYGGTGAATAKLAKAFVVIDESSVIIC